MIRKTIILFILFIFHFPYSTLLIGSSKDGGLPGYFLNQGLGVRSLGMGRAYTSAADDSSAVYWNPAALARMRNSEVAGGHLSLFENTRYNFLSYAGQLNKRVLFGAGIIQLASTGIEIRDEYNNPGSNISDFHNAYLLSAGYALRHNLSCGMSFKAIHNIFDDINTIGYGLDLSILYSFYNDKFSAGTNVQNILRPALARSFGKHHVPLSVKTGVSWQMLKSLLVSLDIDSTVDRTLKWHGGTEWRKEFLSLRCGYDNSLTGGFGIRFKDYKFDYAIYKHTLGYSHRGAVSYLFGAVERLEKPKRKSVLSENIKKDHSVLVRSAENIPCAVYDLLETKEFSVINVSIENKTDIPTDYFIEYHIDGKRNPESKTITVMPKTSKEIDLYPILPVEVISNIEIHTPALNGFG